MIAEPHSRQLDALAMQQALEEARARTLELFRLVKDEQDLRRPPADGFRPILWHLGHMGAYEAYWILQQAKGAESPSSYYEALFDPIKTPREDASNLPSIPDIESYLASIREGTLEYLNTREGSREGYAFNLVLEHELQHQETVLFLLHLLDGNLNRPIGWLGPTPAPEAQDSAVINILEGEVTLGSTGEPFAYDNEIPQHRVHAPAFQIDRNLVTCGEFQRFVDDGGYTREELWSSEGWSWREEQEVSRPYSWLEPGVVRGLFGNREFVGSEPVWGISWHEASAYAKWAGRRLPSEIEWERAARGDDARIYPWGDEPPSASRANFDGSYAGPSPVGAFPAGASPFGVLDMSGNVWEWTATEFGPYPGFTAFPYPEYSELWFDGDHRVLKGGSWATRGRILRTSFRNFYRRGFRIGFVGFRLAG